MIAVYILIALGFIALLLVGIYNGLIRLRNKVDEAWADIDTQLKKRYDLIPNIVSTVKGYASHEKDTFQQVTEARTAAMGANTVQEKQQAENMLSSALKSIFALAENYPELKANQNFLHLQTTLTEVEEHIQLSRRYYNATVRDFNTKLQVFPNNMIAGPFGFEKRDFFEIENDEEKQAPKVSFNDKEVKEEAPKKEEVHENKEKNDDKDKDDKDDDDKKEIPMED